MGPLLKKVFEETWWVVKALNLKPDDIIVGTIGGKIKQIDITDEFIHITIISGSIYSLVRPLADAQLIRVRGPRK